MKYTKDDVETHNDGCGRQSYPAVNVKRDIQYIRTDKVMEKFGCSEQAAEHALQLAWDSGVEYFWNEAAPELVREHFGAKRIQANGTITHDKPTVKMYSAGRSGGWLIIDGLDEIETWNAIDLMRWRRFEKAIQAEIRYQSSEAQVLDAIEANQWAHEDSEQYNFIETASGQRITQQEIKAAERAGREALLKS